MHRMIHAFIIATPLLAAAACMADGGTGSTTDDQDTQSADGSETAAAAQAATQTTAWTTEAVDPAQDANPDTCTRLHSFNDSSCPSGFVCLWQNANRLGFGVAESDGCRIDSMTNVKCQIGTQTFPCTNGHGTFNDEMSSWENNTGHQSCWFFNANFGSTAVLMSAHTTHNNVAAGNNDQASSLRPASQGC